MDRAGGVVDPAGHGPVPAVVRQLWGPILADGTARAVLGGSDPAWRSVETYRVVPHASRARILVPHEPRLAAAALDAYPGLRPRVVSLGRGLASAVARLGVPPGLSRLRLEVPVHAPDPLTPLRLAAEAVGRPQARAAIGVREGANAKATLQLFDPGPVGFAKVAWEAQSADFVRREHEALVEIDGAAGTVRVPRVLGSGTWGDHPYLVTEPLPADVHRPAAHEGPRAAELVALAPQVRVDVPRSTAHLQAVAARLMTTDDPAAGPLIGEARALLDRVLADDRPLPVVARWHGDLVPWNVARAGDGTLWVWDWETVDRDVVIGLDAVHWTLHAPARVAPDRLAPRLAERIPGLRTTLAEMAAPAHAAEVAVAVHVLAMVDRGLSLAAARGGWQSVHVGPDALRGLVAESSRAWTGSPLG